MNDLNTITEFASTAEKLGIIGILFIFLAYKIYQYQAMSKQIGQVLQDLKEQSKELSNILKHQLDFQSKFMIELKEELRDIKSKTNDIHLHCKESANIMRDTIRRSDI